MPLGVSDRPLFSCALVHQASIFLLFPFMSSFSPDLRAPRQYEPPAFRLLQILEQAFRYFPLRVSLQTLDQSSSSRALESVLSHSSLLSPSFPGMGLPDTKYRVFAKLNLDKP